MAAAQQGPGRGLTAINITPMVDIMLVLLVIFMVASAALQRSEGLQIDRPDSDSADPIGAETPQLAIACGRDGSIAVDGVVMATENEVRAAIEHRVSRVQAALRAVVACDAASSVGSLVHVLDLLRRAGVTQYAIATEPSGAPHERS